MSRARVRLGTALLAALVAAGCDGGAKAPPPGPAIAPLDALHPGGDAALFQAPEGEGTPGGSPATSTPEAPAAPPADARPKDPAEPAPNPWDGNEPIEPEPPPPPEPEPEIAREPVREGAIARFPGIRIWVEEKRLEVDGFVCLKRGPALELMGCTRNGKTHESLLLFDCNPEQLCLALILLGLEPVPQVEEFGQPIALDKGERVVIEVEWAAAASPEGDPSLPAAVDGKVRRRVEDLIWDQVRRAPKPRVGWVFTGSRHVEVPAPPRWDTMRKVFAATYAGNIAATYHDPDCVLDTPLAAGGDDTVYLPYSERLPERGTEVVIHIRPWRDGDGPGRDGKPAPTPGQATPPAGQAPAGGEGTPGE